MGGGGEGKEGLWDGHRGPDCSIGHTEGLTYARWRRDRGTGVQCCLGKKAYAPPFHSYLIHT